MRRIARAVTLAVLALVGAASVASAQSAALNEELLTDWLEMKSTLVKLAGEMPEDKWAFKATPPQRDFRQQVLHVAQANVINLAFLRGKAPAPAINRQAMTRAEAVKAMTDSFDYGEALIREQTPQSLFEVVQTNAFLGPSTRARVVYFLLGHSWDIYGQMAVYVRLNGGTPPASQRP